jgi:hypothetical protein
VRGEPALIRWAGELRRIGGAGCLIGMQRAEQMPDPEQGSRTVDALSPLCVPPQSNAVIDIQSPKAQKLYERDESAGVFVACEGG